MESTKSEFFCHTCKKFFAKVVADPDEETVCQHCGDAFVELIEEPAQIAFLNNLYKLDASKLADKQEVEEEFFDCNSSDPNHPHHHSHEEEKKEQSQPTSQPTSQPNPTTQQQQQRPQQQQQFINLQEQLNNMLRGQGGQTTTINQNGQNFNVTTLHGQNGDTQITIANIENLLGGGAGDIQIEEEEYEEGEEVPIDQMNLDIQIDNIEIDEEMMEQLQQQQQPQPDQANAANGQVPNAQQPQQPQPQQQYPGFPLDIQGLINGILGGAGANGQANPHVNVVHQVINLGPGAPGAQPQPGQQNHFNQGIFNIFGGGNGFPAFNFGGAQLEQNILNQVLEQSIQSALNQQHGTPTSKSFIEKLKIVQGSELSPDEEKECRICFEQAKDEDKLIRLPCKHLFHNECILPWLDKHNTCPSCRAELPTDDLDYENRRRQDTTDPISNFLNQMRRPPQGGAGGSSSGGNNPNSSNSSMYA